MYKVQNKLLILCFMKAFILISVASLVLLTSCTSTYSYLSTKRDKYRYKEQKIAHFNYIPEDLPE